MPEASSIFVFATALTNLTVAVYSGRETLRKAKDGATFLKDVQEHTSVNISQVATEVGALTGEVASLTDRITKDLQLFNERFKASQEQLTIVLKAILGDDSDHGSREA